MSTSKIRKTLMCLIVLLLSASVISCGSHNNDTQEEITSTTANHAEDGRAQMTVVKSNEIKKDEGRQMTLTGQILYQKMEGGFFGFIANNGDKYTPSGLKNEYRKNGLIVELKVELMPNVYTTTQFGESIKVLDIKVLDSSKVTDIQKNL